MADANGDYGRVQVRRVGGRPDLGGTILCGLRSSFFSPAAQAPLASTCHATFPHSVLFVALAPHAALSFLVLVLGFIMVVLRLLGVRLTLVPRCCSRARACREDGYVGVTEGAEPTTSFSLGSSMFAVRWRGACRGLDTQSWAPGLGRAMLFGACGEVHSHFKASYSSDFEHK